MKRTLSERLSSINDIVLASSASIALLITLLDFLGVLNQISWLKDRVETIILLSVSLLLLSVVLERKTHLEKIQNTLDSLIASYTFGTQYLENANLVTTQIERATRRANETILSLGSKSRASAYLQSIETAVVERKVIHYRLLDGLYIRHELHEHLERILNASNVNIAWNPREKFGNLVVTENECILAFPAPYMDKFSGLLLPGENNSRRYSQYFLEAYSQSFPVRTKKAIASLCLQCSPTTAGDPVQIHRILEYEFKNSFDPMNEISFRFPNTKPEIKEKDDKIENGSNQAS